MFKKLFILLISIMLCIAAYPQGNTRDTAINPISDISAVDTTIDYDQLFSDFDAFMDSILSPRSYFLTSVSVAKGYYNFINKGNSSIDASKRLIYSPNLGYYHKGGLGLTATGYITNDGTNMNLYQFAISPSFDYLQNRDLATGISFTRYFTKDSLPFYTTPIQNEVSAYFTWRKWWVKPMVAISYGWGNRSEYTERETSIQDLRIRRRGFTYVNTEETVSDFSVMTSVRHDFYWLDVFTGRDHIRFTPQISFTSGTQKFGFNQSSGTYVTGLRTANNVLFGSENVYLDDELKFQPLSLSMFLRGEYSIGKFFMQPQLMLDYYFPAATDNFSTLFSFTAGFIF